MQSIALVKSTKFKIIGSFYSLHCSKTLCSDFERQVCRKRKQNDIADSGLGSGGGVLNFPTPLRQSMRKIQLHVLC